MSDRKAVLIRWNDLIIRIILTHRIKLNNSFEQIINWWSHIINLWDRIIKKE